MNQSIADLLDKEAIRELVFTYCRAIDRRDRPLGHSIWHVGATADYGSFYRGPGPGVIDAICVCHPYLVDPTHQVGNILIELSGDRASSESYVTATMQMQQGDEIVQIETRARYLDRWERRDDRWGLLHREAITDSYTIQTVRHHGSFEARAYVPADDPSYRVLTQRVWGALIP